MTSLTSNPITEDLARRIPKRVHADMPSTLPDAWRTFFRYNSPRIMLGLALISVVAKIAVGGWTRWDLAVAAVVIGFWPVMEWLIHVFILHFKPITILGRKIDPLTAQKHRAHHRDPWRLELVFIPTHILPYAGPLALGFYWLVLPTVPLALTALATYFVFSFHYEWVCLLYTSPSPRD